MTRPNTVADFWNKVEKSDHGCWLWTDVPNTEGYGVFVMSGRRTGAHRFSYEQLVGPIPAGLHLDHLCRVRHCVNPEHLEPVTPRENSLRGVGRPAQLARATHCVRGHEFNAENMRRIGRQQRRICILCRREASLARRAKRAQRIAADPSLAPHGLTATYLGWGCRCEECKAVWSDYMREYRQRRKASEAARELRAA